MFFIKKVIHFLSQNVFCTHLFFKKFVHVLSPNLFNLETEIPLVYLCTCYYVPKKLYCKIKQSFCQPFITIYIYCSSNLLVLTLFLFPFTSFSLHVFLFLLSCICVVCTCLKKTYIFKQFLGFLN